MGHRHSLALANNQDAYILLDRSDLLIAVVCDGCSEYDHSEVGAVIGSRLIAQAVARHVDIGKFHHVDTEFWEQVRQDVLAQIRLQAIQMGGRFNQCIRDHFLFTTLVAVVTHGYATFASIGDGVMFVNGELIDLPAAEGNRPPYIALDMLPLDEDIDPQSLRFRIQRSCPTDELNHFLIGTDGVRDFIENQDSSFPNRREVLGPIFQFWEQSQYFDNPDTVRRTLAKANKAAVKIDNSDPSNPKLKRFPGLLPDDATVIVGRFIKE